MGTTSKEHPVEGPPANAPRLRDRIVRDPFFVSDAKKKEYGIRPDETLGWARDAERWSKIEFTDRQEDLCADPQDGGMAGRLVHTKEFDKVRIGGSAGDLVLMAFPKSIMDDRQAEIDDHSSDFQQNMERTDDGWESEEPPPVRKSRSQMLAEHEKHLRAGLIGGPTAGLSLLAAERLMERKYSTAEIEAKQERLRMGAQHTEMSDRDTFDSMMGASKKMIADRNRKSVSMGDSGFGRNPNSAVAQAARRERRV